MSSNTYVFQTVSVPGAQGNVTIGGINDFGELSGSYTVWAGTGPMSGDPFPQAFTETNGTVTTYGVGSPLSGQHLVSGGVNNSGTVVGSSGSRYEAQHGFMYAGGSFTSIGGTADQEFAQSFGINDSGQAVGAMTPFGGGPTQGYLWSGGTMTAIAYPGAGATYATGINDSGRIVGYYAIAPNGTGSQQYRGFLDVNGQFSQINVPGAQSTQVEAISNKGEIVGTYYDGQHYHGFIDQGGKMTFINAPGATDTWVNAVNDLGQIAGAYETSSSGPTVGFVATPGTTQTLMADFSVMLPKQVSQHVGKSSGHAYFDPTVQPVVIAAAHS